MYCFNSIFKLGLLLAAEQSQYQGVPDIKMQRATSESVAIYLVVLT